MNATVFENLKSLIKTLFLCALPLTFAIIAKRYSENVTAYASSICAFIALANMVGLTLLRSYRNPLLESIQLRTSEMTSLVLLITSSLLLSLMPALQRNVAQLPVFWITVIGFFGALFLFFFDIGLEVMLYLQNRHGTKKTEVSLN
jgi:hypothetical protein